MALFAYSISVSKEYKTVSLVFTDKPVTTSDASTEENGILFKEDTDFTDVNFGTYKAKTSAGKRMKKSDKAELKKLRNNFTQGTKFKNLQFSKKADENGFFKVKLAKK